MGQPHGSASLCSTGTSASCRRPGLAPRHRGAGPSPRPAPGRWPLWGSGPRTPNTPSSGLDPPPPCPRAPRWPRTGRRPGRPRSRCKPPRPRGPRSLRRPSGGRRAPPSPQFPRSSRDSSCRWRRTGPGPPPGTRRCAHGRARALHAAPAAPPPASPAAMSPDDGRGRSRRRAGRPPGTPGWARSGRASTGGRRTRRAPSPAARGTPALALVHMVSPAPGPAAAPRDSSGRWRPPAGR